MGNILPSIASFGAGIKQRKIYNKHMHLLALVSWWYGLGWLDQVALVRGRFVRATDRYSLALLFRTLFSPFKQLDANNGGKKALDAQFRAWVDRLVSRCIGAMIRSFMILVGSVVLVFEAVFAVFRLVMWPILPIAPLIGLIVTATGWIPWQA